MNEYSIELRIEGENLNFDALSTDLCLQPSFLRDKDEQSSIITWGYNGSDQYDQPIYWTSFEEGFLHVLNKLLHLKDKLILYKSEYKMYFWCGHFHKGFDGGPYFSSTLIKLLADFGIEVYIDTYFSQ